MTIAFFIEQEIWDQLCLAVVMVAANPAFNHLLGRFSVLLIQTIFNQESHRSSKLLIYSFSFLYSTSTNTINQGSHLGGLGGGLSGGLSSSGASSSASSNSVTQNVNHGIGLGGVNSGLSTSSSGAQSTSQTSNVNQGLLLGRR